MAGAWPARKAARGQSAALPFATGLTNVRIDTALTIGACKRAGFARSGEIPFGRANRDNARCQNSHADDIGIGTALVSMNGEMCAVAKLLIAVAVAAAITGGGLWSQRAGHVQAEELSGDAASQARPADANANAGASPSLSIYVDPHWQKSRLDQCMSQMAQYQAAGLWLQGDGTPVVDRDKWEALGGREKTAIFDIAACIGAKGQMLVMAISVLDSQGGKVIEARRVISDRDFEQAQE